MNRCLYCDACIEDETNVPAVDDDPAWGRLAAEHAAGCEWVQTRAHRGDTQNSDKP